MTQRDDDGYDAAANSAGSYDAAIRAIRLEGVKAGRFLPLPERDDEIRASPLVAAVRRIGNCVLYNGDMTAIVALLAEHGPMIDACVTDPPYELGFMGKAWDSSGVAADWRTWGGVRIAMKPGAHLVAFAGSRTYHRIAGAVDNAGFEVRDQLMWLYGSGFPKNFDVAKAMDKEAGATREVVGRRKAGMGSGKTHGMQQAEGANDLAAREVDVTLPATATATAKRWAGWGTAVKPSHEPVVFARKPLSEDTIAANVLRWGTGAINVDGARVGDNGGTAGSNFAKTGLLGIGGKADIVEIDGGRWPANVMHDGSLEVLEGFPASARDAIRYFYHAKADKADREFGLAPSSAVAIAGVGALRDGGRGSARANVHPTVKPTDVMRWLIRLVTPPGGTVLDPFMGSGSTGVAAVREGARFVGVERDPEYFEIACRRIAAAVAETETQGDIVHEITKATRRIKKGGGQGELL